MNRDRLQLGLQPQYLLRQVDPIESTETYLKLGKKKFFQSNLLQSFGLST